MSGDVVELVEGVNKLSCALIGAAKGGEGGWVQNTGGPGWTTRGWRVNAAECHMLSIGQHLSRSTDRALKCAR